MISPSRTFGARLAKSHRLGARLYATPSISAIKRQWNDRLVISEEVEHALRHSKPIVALESAIITHGMPHPKNYETAQSVESILRSQGITPATIALIAGKIHIGLSEALLAQISDTGFKSVKVSRRDLAPVLSMNENGGTTVAGTMYIARSVGIPLFVTGGIGGVHRGAESSMDISADLIELGRTPMGVICAGAKSILDIPRTLEVLETQGVCVAAYGQKQFPAFYTPSSGANAPWRVDNPTSAAQLIHTGLSLPNPLATLLAVPPLPSTSGDKVQEAVEQAVRESKEQGIDKRGKEATPWLLRRVGELSGGLALDLNIKLIENNARVGAEVAKAMALLEDSSPQQGNGDGNGHASSSLYFGPSSGSSISSAPISSSSSSASASSNSDRPKTGPSALPTPTVQVFGSAAIDITTRPTIPLEPRTTTPGSILLTPGGVGRNIAEAAQALLPRDSVQLVSCLGAGVGTPSHEGTKNDNENGGVDGFGKVLISEMESVGMRTDGFILSKKGGRTAGCTLSLGMEGDLNDGVADMGIVEELTPEVVEKSIRAEKPSMVVFDCNILPESIEALVKTCSSLGIPTFCDPTSTPKLPRLLSSLRPSAPLTHLSPNLLELDLLHSLISSSLSDEVQSDAWGIINNYNLLADFRAKLETWTSKDGGKRSWIMNQGVVQKAVGVLPFVENLWIKCGNLGLVHVHIVPAAPDSNGDGRTTGDRGKELRHDLPDGRSLRIRHYPSPGIKADEIVSTTGAGDTLVGGLVAGLVGQMGEKEEVWVERALERVVRTMKSHRAVG